MSGFGNKKKFEKITVPKDKEVLENNSSYIWQDNNIIWVVFKLGVELSLDIAKKMVHDRKQISKCVTMPIFIDIRQLITANRKVRRYMASSEAIEFISAGDMLIDNPIARFLGNTWIKFDKPSIPTKLFTDKESALEWLESYK